MMKKNDTVQYIGCSAEQVRWGNNDDPRSFLILGREYEIEMVDVRSQHTKIKLYNTVGWFNSVCFRVTQQVNSPLNYNKNMEPSDINLESTSKLFEYEKLSREIENCDSVEELRKMCRCFVKLHLKHQEITLNMLKTNMGR